MRRCGFTCYRAVCYLLCTCGKRAGGDDAVQRDLRADLRHRVLKRLLKPRALGRLLISRHVGIIRGVPWREESRSCLLFYLDSYFIKYLLPSSGDPG